MQPKYASIVVICLRTLAIFSIVVVTRIKVCCLPLVALKVVQTKICAKNDSSGGDVV